MNTIGSQIRANLIYGALALLPVAALIFIIFSIYETLAEVLEPIFPFLGNSSFLDVAFTGVVAILFLLVACYLIGATVNTQLGELSFNKVEGVVRSWIPGYEIFTKVARGVVKKEIPYPPALISLSDPSVAVIGFIIEDDGSAYVTVFTPSTPLVMMGSVHIVDRSRITRIDGTSLDAANCIGEWGLGLRKLIGSAEMPKIS